MSDDARSPAPLSHLTEAEQHILNAIAGIRFGTVAITIHDSRIVQVEKSEKFRFDHKKAPEADTIRV